MVLIAVNLHTPTYQIQYKLPHRYAVDDPQFRQAMSVLLGPPLLEGNKVTALQNGDEIFPAMLEAIRGAEKTITFETFIYWSGEIGKEFSDALSERARAGVRVHVLLDWLGSNKVDEEYVRNMQQAGVEVAWYRPLSWYHLSRMNSRTHRKLLVVDGRIGFTGGVGIADLWLGDGTKSDHWRDSHYRVEGPAVAQIQAAFCDNWIKTESEVFTGDDYFPLLQPAGEMSAQMVKSSQQEGSENVHLMYLLSIASATKRIQLQAAYFVPDELTIETLLAAIERGVRVEIIVPSEKTDTQLVRNAGRSLLQPLLDAGVEFYEFQPAMFHCKLFIVDDVWVSVGSTNFDNRSFQLNDEANLNVYDREFAAEQVRVFERDKQNSRRIDPSEFRDRPWHSKVAEKFASIFKRQL